MIDIADNPEQEDAHPAPSVQLPLLCDIAEVAFLLGISKATAWKLDSTGRLPRAIRLGRRTLWRRAELEAWVAADAPLRERWEKLRKGEA